MTKPVEPFAALREDSMRNRREFRTIALVVSFRITQAAMGDLDRPRALSLPLIALHRFFAEFVLQMELRPRTHVGPGLCIHHGYGIVINDHAVIGRNVTLRNGVTIGHARPGGGSPRIADHVDVGAGALIIGDVTVGEHAVVGAGAVVVRGVPPNATVVGNPARALRAPGGEASRG